MNVLLFGPYGYLGSAIRQDLYPDAIGDEADIADERAVNRTLDEYPGTEIVINAAGYTGSPSVDACEATPEAKHRTIRSNTIGPLVLARACEERGIRMVHLGSGCIFQGDAEHAFTEEDLPNFRGSFYSRSKLAADEILRDADHVLNLRFRMPFDGTTSGRNLLIKLSKYRKLLDIENSMTSIPTLLGAIRVLVTANAHGTFHIVNEGTTTPYKLMLLYQQIRHLVGPRHAIEKMPLSELSVAAKTGRSNCVLSNEKAKKFGVKFQSVESAAEDALRQIAKQLDPYSPRHDD